MEVKLDDIEILTILQALETLHDQAQEYRDVVYDSPQDFLLDMNKTRLLHNELLIQAQNEGIIEKEANLI